MNGFVNYLRYSLTLNAPAIVTTVTGDPNSASTQPFIPGNAIRGAVAGVLISQGVQPAGEELHRFVSSGHVRYLHAYPANQSDRSLPTPLGWRGEKGIGAAASYNAFDLAAFTGRVDAQTDFDRDADGTLTITPEDTWPAVPLQREGIASFVSFTGSRQIDVPVRTDARSHQQRDRNKGRSWKRTHNDGREEPQGALFAFEYLEAGQVFHGVIQVVAATKDKGTETIEELKKMLHQKTIYVGRSRRAGYGGKARVEVGSIEQLEANWSDVQQDHVAANSSFRAYLLSSCIVRDSFTGQIDPAALPAILVQRLGGESVLEVERMVCNFEAIGGFNRKWQIEVPQALAIQAGSVAVLKAKQAIPVAQLRDVEHTGIGERRIEGFGRLLFLCGARRKVAITHQPTERFTIKEPRSEPPKLITFLQQRLLDAAFDRALAGQVRDIIRDARKIPTSSLIGRLRVALRHGDPSDALRTLQQMMRDVDQQDRTMLKEAQDKLRNCRLNSDKSLQDWVKEAATNSFGTRKAMDALRTSDRLGEADELVNEIARERGAHYAVRLIDAVLEALARMNQVKRG